MLEMLGIRKCEFIYEYGKCEEREYWAPEVRGKIYIMWITIKNENNSSGSL